MVIASSLGFPRLGSRRELKNALEQYWSGATGQDELLAVGRAIRQESWEVQKSAGLDQLVAALILQVWAIVLDRRDSRARPIKGIEFVAANSVAACAVGVKTSAAIAIGLPLIAYWVEFLARAVRRVSRWHLPFVLNVVVLGWLFFCWQYLANVVVLGAITDKNLAHLGMSYSAIGALVHWGLSLPAPSSPQVYELAFGLTVLVVAALVQRSGWEPLIVRISAL